MGHVRGERGNPDVVPRRVGTPELVARTDRGDLQRHLALPGQKRILHKLPHTGTT